VDIVTMDANRPEDLLAVRAASRAIAARLDVDETDQVRLATALSEIGREVIGTGGTAVVFSVESSPVPAIVVTFLLAERGDDLTSAAGVAAARRLVDGVDLQEPPAPAVRVVKHIPRHAGADRASLAASVRAVVPPLPIEELWSQNRQLASALAEVQAKQEETLRLNAELEETNTGVMAMYGQLSEELEETNRGVVALYAELDDKSVQLQEAGTAKSRFFTAVSHELRSPVNSILALTRVFTEADADPLTAEQRHQVGLIASAATDLSELVNQLLDIAKAEAGRLEPDVEAVDLAALAAELRGSLRALVDERRITLSATVAADVPKVETDRALVGQILRNLLVNAVRFTEDGEISLTISLTEPRQHVQIEVSDTGIGIAPEHQERVFEEFFQVRGPLQVRSRGTGLGLAHSRRLTEALGGHIELRSELGTGSTFTVLLPVHWNAAMAGGSGRVAATIVSDRTVMIVDDDEGFRTALRGMLQGLSQRVSEASGGEEALALMAADRPDVVFLDLRMPDLGGAEVLARMGAEPLLRDVPVVIVTSVDLGIDVANLGRAHALLAKAEVTHDRVMAVLADLDQAATP
jgi:signal transduction histidine kinase/ActR/RegA family two-component response regulator